MADPSRLDITDWFAVVAGGILSGLGSAFVWFSNSKRRIHDRLTTVEHTMTGWSDKHAQHTTDIAVIETCAQNTAKQLEAISLTTRDTNEKLECLSGTITQVLLALQAKK